MTMERKYLGIKTYVEMRNKIHVRIGICLLLAVICTGTVCTADEAEAIYLGVSGYGTEDVNRDNMDSFLYRFEIDGQEVLYRIDPGTPDPEGRYDYSVQNTLKEGYAFHLETVDDRVVSAEELPWEAPSFSPAVPGTRGERTVLNFLRTAMEPAGTALYVYGGGWNWQDSGAGPQAVNLGVSSDWVKFFNEQDAEYTYRDRNADPALKDPPHSYYPYYGYNEYYYAGVDCSGYLGWALYNTFETEEGQEGYVVKAQSLARELAERGLGTRRMEAAGLKPGDIVSLDGHVWVSLGTCSDGSILCIHSTPSASRNGQPGGGVQLSAIGAGRECEAYALADAYMAAYCPRWYERYEPVVKDPGSYLTFSGEGTGVFSWDTEAAAGLSDPDGIRNADPRAVLDAVLKK